MHNNHVQSGIGIFDQGRRSKPGCQHKYNFGHLIDEYLKSYHKEYKCWETWLLIHQKKKRKKGIKHRDQLKAGNGSGKHVLFIYFLKPQLLKQSTAYNSVHRY